VARRPPAVTRVLTQVTATIREHEQIAPGNLVLVAVSGGPDSLSLVHALSELRRLFKMRLAIFHFDHRLREDSGADAAYVRRIGDRLGLDVHVRTAEGTPPKGESVEAWATGQRGNAATDVRREIGAASTAEGHTLDDQAETVLIRMARGSGLTGLGAMARMSRLPSGGEGALTLVRPLLDIPKSRLVATLRAQKINYADDPSNRDPRFTRVRLRGLMEVLAHEGLDARRLTQLARRLKRAEAAIEAAVDCAATELAAPANGSIVIEARAFAELPAEIALRLLGRAVARTGDEGPVELGKLEALKSALDAAESTANGRFRRTLAGAVVSLEDDQVIVERAPPRGRKLLTKRGPRRLSHAKTR
jgi:tRNA(Ile)-lysidine synthase